jgi:hypothetical protein
LTWTRKGKRSNFLEIVAPMPVRSTAGGTRARPDSGKVRSRQPRALPAGSEGERTSAPPRLARGSWLPEWMRDRRSGK